MAFNIYTGHNGIRRREGNEIVILVSSLRKLDADAVPFLFTDRHASVIGARFSSRLDDLNRVDWGILQHRDFSRDNEDIGKTSRYQAEALVYGCMPVNSLLGVACYDGEQKGWIDRIVTDRKLDFKVLIKRGWYF